MLNFIAYSSYTETQRTEVCYGYTVIYNDQTSNSK